MTENRCGLRADSLLEEAIAIVRPRSSWSGLILSIGGLPNFRKNCSAVLAEYFYVGIILMYRLDFVPLFYISTPLTDFFQDLFCTLKFQNSAWFFYANSDHNLFYLSNPPQI